MAFNKTILHQIRIVPLRFTRCVDPANADTSSGPVRADCPDPDDRGFGTTQHATLLPIAFDSAAGTGDTAHVKVIRLNIDNAASLFVQSDTQGVVTVEDPAANTALAARQNMIIRLQARSAGTARIKILFGDARTGPVVAELAVVVNNLTPVDVVLHRTSITGGGTGSPDPARVPLVGGNPDFSGANTLLNNANNIWRPHGVRFRVINQVQSTMADTAAGVLTQTAGTTPTLNTLFGTNRTAHAINIHFIRIIGTGGTRGIGRTLVLAPTSYALVLPDNADANDLAHELGHVLNLDFHARPAGGGDHADDEVGGKRTDIWTTRRLMHSFNPFAPAQPYQADVGYGANNRGALITSKDVAIDTTDNESSVAHNSAQPPLP